MRSHLCFGNQPTGNGGQFETEYWAGMITLCLPRPKRSLKDRGFIDSDQSVPHSQGEEWKVRPQGCRNAVYLAVGTGIGAAYWLTAAYFATHDIAKRSRLDGMERPLTRAICRVRLFETNLSRAKAWRNLLGECLLRFLTDPVLSGSP